LKEEKIGGEVRSPYDSFSPPENAITAAGATLLFQSLTSALSLAPTVDRIHTHFGPIKEIRLTDQWDMGLLKNLLSTFVHHPLLCPHNPWQFLLRERRS
jgi:hypothetical protein